MPLKGLKSIFVFSIFAVPYEVSLPDRTFTLTLFFPWAKKSWIISWSWSHSHRWADIEKFSQNNTSVLLVCIVTNFQLPEPATRGILCKKVLLEISQNSQENTCARVSFLIKLQASGKKGPWHRCFPVNFAKFLRTPSLHKNSGRLLLSYLLK